ncbi:zinc finger FYVE domain-containing protein 9 isoform X2 [Narcine bancroftii]|uniref:zinc finger FYVE domain-containing protein 9 isoform X2 n=1 Tax=Narcine bancroftii TaxID=1343680 RepID=UPI0038311988
MENYFQAEAFNLDKVLDEFEQNEDETETPSVFEAKWNQILDPPSHLLSLNPALSNVNVGALSSELQAKLKCCSSPKSDISVFGGDHCLNGNDTTENRGLEQCGSNDEGSLVMNKNNCDHWPNFKSTVTPACEDEPTFSEDMNSSNIFGVIVNNSDSQLELSGDLLSEDNSNDQNTLNVNSFLAENSNLQRGPLLSDMNGKTEKTVRKKSVDQLNTPCTDEQSVKSSMESLKNCTDLENVSRESWRIEDLSVISEQSALSGLDGAGNISELNNSFSGETEASDIISEMEDESIQVKNDFVLKSSDDLDHLTNTLILGDLDNCTELRIDSERAQSQPFGLCSDNKQPHLIAVQSTSNSSNNCNYGSNEHFENDDAVMCINDKMAVYQETNDILIMERYTTDLSCQSSKMSSQMDDQLNQHMEQIGHEALEENGELVLDVTESLISRLNPMCGGVKKMASTSCLPCDVSDSLSVPNLAVACVSKSLPLKEDSVTEEKEREESKLENCFLPHQESNAVEAGVANGLKRLSISTDIEDHLRDNYFNTPNTSAVTDVQDDAEKLALNNAQSVSIPFGGARPKQPLNLKLQIPKPLTNQLLNDLGSTNPVQNAKNKNVCFTDKAVLPEESCLNGGNSVPDGSGDADELGVCYAPASKDINTDCVSESESPNNDLQIGQFPAPLKKPFTSLGDVAPVWVPDSQAPNCMKCEVKFTFTKRRHHCRACGKVFCAACCNLKYKLSYMDMKEARVCVTCHSVLSSLAHPKEQRRVWFADGILPNGEVAEAAKLSAGGPAMTGSLTVSHDPGKEVATKPTTSENVSTSMGNTAQIGSPVGSAINLVPVNGLPPILISTGVKGDYAVEEQPSQISLMLQLEEGGPDPLVFVLNANLLVMVKLVNYVNRKCWSFTTKGMHAVGQAEIVILLQCLPDEKCIPKDIFNHCIQLYQDALAGNVVGELGHSFFTQSFLGSREHGGFLYVMATFQSLQDLVLPNAPYLFGILIQKWETPWAKVFPIRLMLRLGAEYRFYPCPLFSVRFRKPLFGETGHTIMNLLADFRNYQYKLPVVQGLVVDMEVRKTCINVPSNRYNEMMKAMNKSNEHVLAFGACFNERADSHLVCVQNDDGNYQTQAISIHNQPRKVTGASFFVFSGALKSSSGYLAKSSIVEDGMMVQISAETMDSLRQAIREMKDFTITCGKADAEEPQEYVHIHWTEDDKNINKGLISPIDGKSMDEIVSVKIFHGSEFKTNGKVIRWTEVFFLQSEEQPSDLSDPADHSKLAEKMAKAFCLALCPHLKLLKEDGKSKLGLRVTLDSDQVEYQTGSNGQPLPSQYMNDLDSALVPVIHGGACQLSEGPVVMELIFYILESFS